MRQVLFILCFASGSFLIGCDSGGPGVAPTVSSASGPASKDDSATKPGKLKATNANATTKIQPE